MDFLELLLLQPTSRTIMVFITPSEMFGSGPMTFGQQDGMHKSVKTLETIRLAQLNPQETGS
jgi:hypothetical protein